MDIAKIKNSIPAINKENIIGGLKSADKQSFLLGMSGVISIYVVILIFVWTQSTATLQKIETALISETVSINTNARKHISQQASTRANFAIEGIYEPYNGGLIPIIRKSDNLTSFRAYQHPFSFEGIGTKPVISFIILDYGLGKHASENILDSLPTEVSLMLSPYSKMPNEWVEMARNKGHEIWLNTPIQNNIKGDTGSYTIYHHNSLADKTKTVLYTLMRAQGYTGITSFTDKSLNNAKTEYIKIMDEIYKRGLGYIELNPNAPITLQKKAALLGAPYMKANINIFKMTGDKNSFDALEKIAHKNGHAIAVIPNYPSAIKNLAVWLLKVAQADYILAPVSAMYDLPLHRPHMNTAENITPSSLNSHDQVEPEEHYTPSPKHH